MKKHNNPSLWQRSLLVVASLSAFASAPTFAAVNDGDNDGASDSTDVFPCDASVTSLQAIPGENAYASLVYEDQWPSEGDFDFNDLVVDYNVEIYRNASGQAKRVRLTYHPRAMGASFDNGFAVRLPVALSSVPGISVTKKIGNTVTTISPKTGETDVVLVLADNLRSEVFGGAAGPLNTIEANGTVNGLRMELDITFSTAITLSGSDAPFDPFIFRSFEYGHQIHLSRFAGTSQMRQDLFGSLQDGSNASKKFVDARGMPFVLELPTSVAFPQEDKRFDLAYPRVVEFVASNGAQAANFATVGIDATRTYRNALAAAPSIAAVTARSDTSCVVKLGTSSQPATSCKAILDAGASIGSGVYFLDADGAGASPTFQAFCDMTNNGGGWTLAIKANGNNGTFAYDNAIWTNTALLNTANPSTSTAQEAKYETFNSIPFTQVRIQMTPSPFIAAPSTLVIAKSGTSLLSLFSSNFQSTSFGRNTWKSLLSGSSMQTNCNLEGFNVICGGDQRVRIGLVANQENECNSCDSRFGIGGSGSFCSTSGLTVGNTARCTPDNGDKDIVAFGYVWVK